MPSGVAVFDVNETMLDLSGLDTTFARIFGEVSARREWFARLLHLSTTTTLLGGSSDFGTLGAAALSATGVSRGVKIGADERDQLGAAIGALDAYPDVPGGLDVLRAAGWRLFALTNSPAQAATAQLTTAGIIGRFDEVMSVEATGRFKPAREPYLHAAAAIGEKPARLWMVACHDWDLAGAAAVGMRTAYVERPGMDYAPIFTEPTVSAPDMGRLAERMLAAKV